MRILITGNMGYVGPVVAAHLRATLPGVELIGYDAGFFAHCLTTTGPLPERVLDEREAVDVGHGRRVAREATPGAEAPAAAEHLRLTHAGELLAIGELRAGELQPVVVFRPR